MKIKALFKNKNLYLRYIPMSVAAALIIFFAVRSALYPADGEEVNIGYLIFKTVPTLITLVVQILLMAANRYSFLMGGLNSILYGIVYFAEGVPFSAFYAFLISLPIQIYSFFNWKKNSKGSQVELRWLSVKGKLLVLALGLGVWAICYFLLSKYLVNQMPALDTIIFTLGIIVTFLSAVRYIESQYISFVSSILSLIMWIILTVRDPSNINYAIIGVYNLYCIGMTAVNWTILYVKGKRAKEAKVSS